MGMNISLLPAELRHQQKTNKRFSIYIVVLIMVGMLFTVNLIGLLLNNVYSSSNLASVKIQDEQLKQRIAGLQEYADIDANIQKLKSMFSNASSITPQWSTLLFNIGNALPDKVTVTEMKETYSDSSGSISISGWAYTYSDVSDMVVSLAKVPGIENVKLSDATNNTIDNKNVVKFNISAVISKGEARDLDTQGGSRP
jgi:Tfp pilus assembly protein PilN